MEHGDWQSTDQRLGRTLEAWRRRMAELSAITAPLDPTTDLAARELATSPLPESLVHEEILHAVREHGEDPIAADLRPWLETLWLEHKVFDARVEEAVAWGRGREVRGRTELTSARQLRRETIGAAHRSIRERAAVDWETVAESLGEAALRVLERRLEFGASIGSDCRALATPDVTRSQPTSRESAALLAEAMLRSTDEVAAEARSDAWAETLHASMITTSRQGWPVRPSARWIRAVLGSDDWARGLRLGPLKIPASFGAASYARSLGSFGMRVLEASRPSALPLALHQHPLGIRKHSRRALFASIVAETAFARKVLGLAPGPSRDHRRAVAFGFVTSLRVDALRVLVAEALRDGVSKAREAYRELAHRVLGHDIPGTLLGVVPTLRTGDGAALIGTVVASLERRELVDRHDEDWFRNPRALAELRDADGRPRGEATVSESSLEAATVALSGDLSDAIG